MKRKAVRAFAGLLCAAIVFSNAGMRVFAMEEDGAGQETTQESVSENDTGEDGSAQPEDADQPDNSDQPGDTEETGDPEDTEGSDGSGDLEDNDQEGKTPDNTENPEEPPEGEGTGVRKAEPGQRKLPGQMMLARGMNL